MKTIHRDRFNFTFAIPSRYDTTGAGFQKMLDHRDEESAVASYYAAFGHLPGETIWIERFVSGTD